MSASGLSDPITLRLPSDVLAKIEEVAKITERTRSWVMVRALKAYLTQEGADILAIEEGRQQVARGDVIDADQLIAELEADESADQAA